MNSPCAMGGHDWGAPDATPTASFRQCRRCQVYEVMTFQRPGATGRAFPSGAIDDRYGGMSLRDWFAGQAIAGYCAAPDMIDPTEERLAKAAYAIADAMLAEREREA